jgi:(E)-4-hydroxy-3-methylbut-2-enyl-diphosphate synthase
MNIYQILKSEMQTSAAENKTKHIYIQSMLNVIADDVDGNVRQAVELQNAGCEILRVAVPNLDSVRLIYAIKNAISIPLTADIHYDYKIALESVAAGVDKIRINPGNIGAQDRVQAVAKACKAKNIPIRVGGNAGSTTDLLADTEKQIEILNRADFDDIVVSLKASDVEKTVKVNRKFREKYSYPLHIGITEAGTEHMGIIKSAAGLGSLLLDGIGETMRVSLTADPLREIEVAKDILKAIGLRQGTEVISCPTCGRTRIDVIKFATEIEKRAAGLNKNIKIAVMGCAVNGIGESKGADIGVAGGDKCGLIFKNGEILRKVDESEIVEELMKLAAEV